MLVAFLATFVNLLIFTLSCMAVTAVMVVIINATFKAVAFKRRGQIVKCGTFKDNCLSPVAAATALPVWGARFMMQATGKIKGGSLGIEWAKVCDTFCQYHKHPTNVVWHLVCTSLMVLGWLSAADTLLYPGISYALAAAYIGLLACVLPRSELIKSALTMAVLVLVCRKLEMGVAGLIFVVANEVVTGTTHAIWEPAFISTYNRMPMIEFLDNLSEHYFLLLPLGQAAASRIF